MDFIYEIYTLRIEKDIECFKIYLFISVDLTNPLLYLHLKQLNEIDTGFDDKYEVRDIPRTIFKEGDFYQSNVTKHTKSETFGKTSLLAIVHHILLLNRDEINSLKRIYSTSLNNYKEENFITVDAIRFWEKQLEKAPLLPVNFYAEDKRYFIVINY